MPIFPPADHRPWQLPDRPWLMFQAWYELLFAHWAVAPAIIRPLIPSDLVLDTHAGQAWIGVVPFRMSHVRPRWLPPVPLLSFFPELNVRTYVTLDGKPGVWFFSLEAANPIAVRAARQFFHLPYMNADMICDKRGDRVHYRSVRTHSGESEAVFIADYQPTGAGYRAEPGSLESWLTERYALYAADRRGRLYRGEIHHEPWTLHPATAAIEQNTMAAASGITLPDDPPLLHYVEQLEVFIWLLEKVG